MRVVAAILYIVVMAICGLGIQGGALHLQDYPSVYFQGGALQDYPSVSLQGGALHLPDYPSVSLQGGALHLLGYPTISFNLTGATWKTYRDFIEELREIVTRGATTIPGTSLPVLNRVVPDSRRFVYVRLITMDRDETRDVTFAVDVTNVYVVAYAANNRAYFFLNSTELEHRNLFLDIVDRVDLSFSGNYESLRTAADASRESISLGPFALDAAILNLWHNGRGRLAAKSVVVVIQMVAEAARFRQIEERVRRSIADQDTFTPGGLMVSMENNWSSMSREVERAIYDRGTFTGIFTGTVQLQDNNLRAIIVDSFDTLSRYTMIALLLFRCRTTSSSRHTLPAANIVRLMAPVVVLMGEEYYYDKDDKECTTGEPTRRISGRAGWCVDVRDGQDNDGNPIQVWTCGNGHERKQQWTFNSDGTIRSKLGKCMTTSSFKHGAYVMIYDCETAIPDATKWVVSVDGTITNPRSGLVLTAPKGEQGATLLVEKNVHAARQGWRVGDDVEPIVTQIVGLQEMCLQARYIENTNVFLDDCMLDRKQQRWALYSDGTIRADSDRSLCVTADGHSSGVYIIILKCKGWSNQRWVFNTDGTILNPNAKLVMDVKGSDVSLQQIILFEPMGKPNQMWMTVTFTRPIRHVNYVRTVRTL